MQLGITRIVDGRTRHHRVSAAVNNPSDAELNAGPSSMLVLSVDIVCGVIAWREARAAKRIGKDTRIASWSQIPYKTNDTAPPTKHRQVPGLGTQQPMMPQ